MSRWQYRVRPMNLGEWRAWRDVDGTPPPVIVTYCELLQFRRKPRRSRSLAAAVLRRAGDKRQRREPKP